MILAHRANIDGPDRGSENRLPAIAAALDRGWGLELDIRRTPDGRYYISHDPGEATGDVGADRALHLVAGYPATAVALNIKELGYEADLVAYLARFRILDRLFLFDMELLESEPGATARLFRRLHPGMRLAARVSDRGESIEQALAIDSATTIWLDEFDGPWCTAEVVTTLKAAGRLVYAVSPELHQFSLAAARERWTQFCDWGVDGICTDYPAALHQLIVDRGALAS